MNHEDKLTRAERIRLEAFAQAGMRHTMRGPVPLQEQLDEAEIIERWLYSAREQDTRQ